MGTERTSGWTPREWVPGDPVWLPDAVERRCLGCGTRWNADVDYCPECDAYTPKREDAVMNADRVPGWEGSCGPFKGEHTKPHVYARNIHSGSGNCVCGMDVGDWIHVQAAPGIKIPERKRPPKTTAARQLSAALDVGPNDSSNWRELPILTVLGPVKGRVTARCSCGREELIAGSDDDALAWWFEIHLSSRSEHQPSVGSYG